jgi:hypothetical protein
MAIPVLGSIWQVARRVEDVFRDVEKLTQGLKALRDDMVLLQLRVTALEGREELLIERTRTAAATAASETVTTHLVDMSRRIGVLEAGQGRRAHLE